MPRARRREVWTLPCFDQMVDRAEEVGSDGVPIVDLLEKEAKRRCGFCFTRNKRKCEFKIKKREPVCLTKKRLSSKKRRTR